MVETNLNTYTRSYISFRRQYKESAGKSFQNFDLIILRGGRNIWPGLWTIRRKIFSWKSKQVKQTHYIPKELVIIHTHSRTSCIQTFIVSFCMLVVTLDVEETSVNDYTRVYSTVKKIIMQTDGSNATVILFRYKNPVHPWWPLIVAIKIPDSKDIK